VYKNWHSTQRLNQVTVGARPGGILVMNAKVAPETDCHPIASIIQPFAQPTAYVMTMR
jgi:hypothetical protein